MENERTGAIVAKLHNMLGGKKAMQAGDVFKLVKAGPVKKARNDPQGIYDTMMMWTKGGTR